MEIINAASETSVRLHFIHTTTYQYSGPVTFGPHRLVLRPRESHFERLESMEIETEPASVLHWYQDIYGNILARAEFKEAANRLLIRSEFVVNKVMKPGWMDGSGAPLGEDYPAYYPGIEEAATHLYRQSVYPPEVEEIRRWLRGLGILPLPGEKKAIFAPLARKIHETIGYQRREESGVQTPIETLRKGTGSCRDTAVLMMEAGRCIGYATRFVSGYLESENSANGRGSTHAWAEVYLPDRGWVGFDPSIGESVGMGHVAVGFSHHPRGVMPITGRFESPGFGAAGMQVEIQSKQL
ncbi:MAG: transglutaminase family protein [Verrucomicrobiales bacterium]|nr:transglutaminase family protein [Verrucomicrobiales bacterium]